MRNHNKYLLKVHEELDIYKKALMLGDEVEMTETQKENWKKINIIWSLLKDGNTDTEVIKMAKHHIGLKVMDRRARELLYMAYETFADLRLQRNTKAVKMLDSEAYREAAQIVYNLMQTEASYPIPDLKGVAMLAREYRNLKREAGLIDGVYLPDAKNSDEKKVPKKITIRKVIVNNNFSGQAPEQPNNIIDISHEPGE